MPYEGGGLTQAVRIFTAVAPAFGLDIVVRRPDELKQRVPTVISFCAKLPVGERFYMTPLLLLLKCCSVCHSLPLFAYALRATI